jgi:hypothetical protein
MRAVALDGPSERLLDLSEDLAKAARPYFRRPSSKSLRDEPVRSGSGLTRIPRNHVLGASIRRHVVVGSTTTPCIQNRKLYRCNFNIGRQLTRCTVCRGRKTAPLVRFGHRATGRGAGAARSHPALYVRGPRKRVSVHINEGRGRHGGLLIGLAGDKGRLKVSVATR